MAGPVGLPVIDTMIGFPHEGTAQYDFIRKQTKDRESKEDFDFPVEYMFKDVPPGPAHRRSGVTAAAADGSVRHREGDDRRERGLCGRAGAQDVPPIGSLPRATSTTRTTLWAPSTTSAGNTRRTASALSRASRPAPSPQVPIDDPRCTRSTRPASN